VCEKEEERHMPTRSLRGAITVSENTRQAILDATTEMLKALVESNALSSNEVISAVFSATADLDAAYPAEAARALGWTQAGLMCLQEMKVAGSLDRCVRVLILVESRQEQAGMVHCYLRGASTLRPEFESSADHETVRG